MSQSSLRIPETWATRSRSRSATSTTSTSSTNSDQSTCLMSGESAHPYLSPYWHGADSGQAQIYLGTVPAHAHNQVNIDSFDIRSTTLSRDSPIVANTHNTAASRHRIHMNNTAMKHVSSPTRVLRQQRPTIQQQVNRPRTISSFSLSSAYSHTNERRKSTQASSVDVRGLGQAGNSGSVDAGDF